MHNLKTDERVTSIVIWSRSYICVEGGIGELKGNHKWFLGAHWRTVKTDSDSFRFAKLRTSTADLITWFEKLASHPRCGWSVLGVKSLSYLVTVICTQRHQLNKNNHSFDFEFEFESNTFLLENLSAEFIMRYCQRQCQMGSIPVSRWLSVLYQWCGP